MKANNLIRETHDSTNIDNLLVARRLAQFCPTSLSVDDFKSQSPDTPDKKEKVEYIPPTPSVKIEQPEKSAFKLGLPSPKHRFGFLLADIKPIDQSSAKQPPLKMKYELPNVRKVTTPVKTDRPLMVVSFSSTHLNNPEMLSSPLAPTLNNGQNIEAQMHLSASSSLIS
ncbi:hypothetical protein TRFO_05566 [Tritrichomonas foetus]|uniref:Uncharacterized protein n=1 Tax=Tritrichomonas foetus TaxID=1144522 RepID=A0A1J4K9J4_9EUKA|nr:hypothetical protein TRFO_05566 [Tritrichomonas foetus]|eukprot:OHT06372.1 hypothetical protein TRFO_05566 [Tritrichomonas foetus]